MALEMNTYLYDHNASVTFTYTIVTVVYMPASHYNIQDTKLYLNSVW